MTVSTDYAITPLTCRTLRGWFGWSQEELAAKAGVERRTVMRFENGTHDMVFTSRSRVMNAFKGAGLVIKAYDIGGFPRFTLVHLGGKAEVVVLMEMTVTLAKVP